MNGRLGRLIRMVLPWAPKAERRAAIDSARAQAERSRQGAAHARDIEQQIRWLYQQNHWASSVADALGINRKDNGGT
jgi:hypothetical protein